MKQAAELAAEEINATGGINGRPLELVTRDDYADPDSAVFVADDLYEPGVSAVVGHLFSGYHPGRGAGLQRRRRPGGRDLARRRRRRRSPAPATTPFASVPSDLAHGADAGPLGLSATRLHLRGAVLYLNDQYGRGIRQTFVTEFTRLGGELEAIDPYLGERPDVGPYLDRLAHADAPEFLVVAGNRSEAEEILRQARKRGPHDAGARRRRARGHPGGRRAGRGRLPLLGVLPVHSERCQPAASSRRSVASTPTRGRPISPRPATYDAIYLLRDVIARAGTSARAVRRALAGRRIRSTPPYDGVTGTVAFDAERRRPQPERLHRPGAARRGRRWSTASMNRDGRPMTFLRSLGTVSSPAWSC